MVVSFLILLTAGDPFAMWSIDGCRQAARAEDLGTSDASVDAAVEACRAATMDTELRPDERLAARVELVRIGARAERAELLRVAADELALFGGEPQLDPDDDGSLRAALAAAQARLQAAPPIRVRVISWSADDDERVQVAIEDDTGLVRAANVGFVARTSTGDELFGARRDPLDGEAPSNGRFVVVVDRGDPLGETGVDHDLRLRVQLLGPLDDELRSRWGDVELSEHPPPTDATDRSADATSAAEDEPQASAGAVGEKLAVILVAGGAVLVAVALVNGAIAAVGAVAWLATGGSLDAVGGWAPVALSSGAGAALGGVGLALAAVGVGVWAVTPDDDDAESTTASGTTPTGPRRLRRR